MCEMFVMSMENPLNSLKYLKELSIYDNINLHGWGVGLLSDKDFMVIKEPNKITSSKIGKFLLENGVNSKIIFAHLREATKGKLSYENTHPFSFKYNKNPYIFMHNGTLNKLNLDKKNIYTPLGTTDSEKIFSIIIQKIVEKPKGKLTTNNDFKEIFNLLYGLNNLGKLNLFFSDNKNTYCYFDKNGHKGLYYLLIEKENSKGYLISTKKLVKGDWKPISKGSLTVFSEGKIKCQLSK